MGGKRTCTTFGLHFHDLHFLVEDVLLVLRGELITVFTHRGRRGDWENERAVVDPVRRVSDRPVTVDAHFLRLVNFLLLFSHDQLSIILNYQILLYGFLFGLLIYIHTKLLSCRSAKYLPGGFF